MSTTKRPPNVVLAPCAHCPFRVDVPIFLREEFREEIVAEMRDAQTVIPCHEYVRWDEGDDGAEVVGATGPQCAGALKALARAGGSTQMERIEERLGYRRTDADPEHGADVWDLAVWARLPMGATADTFDLDTLEDVATCNTCEENCLAPAGFLGAGGGVFVGTEAATNECSECGEPVCDECIRSDGRCGVCWGYEDGDEAEEDE